MDKNIVSILEQGERCIETCEELLTCFDNERECLVQFRTDDLLANNARKEHLIAQLAQQKFALRQLLAHARRDALLSVEDEQAWSLYQERWLKSWEKLRARCESNQLFMKHSLRNLDMLTDNLRRLMGQQTLYSPKGTHVDVNKAPKVVEGRY